MPADQQPRHQLSPHSANASAEACGERAERFTPSKPTSFDVLSGYSTHLGARKIPRPANALRTNLHALPTYCGWPAPSEGAFAAPLREATDGEVGPTFDDALHI